MQWPKIRIGTRASRLALVQVELVKKQLFQCVPQLSDRIETVVIDTPGDLDRSLPIESLGGRGVFTGSLDSAVASGTVDCVIHAMKDMSPTMEADLMLAATLKREDPREVLVSSKYQTLGKVPAGAVFGSSSIRRRALLRRLRPDLNFELLRGNVEARIAQLYSRQLDGTILAYAGLARLGLKGHIRDIFPLDVLPPDPAQGAIGIICHRHNFVARRLLQQISHDATFAEVTAERALLASLPQPDALAIGAIARVHDKALSLSAMLVSEDGIQAWSSQVNGSVQDSEAIGFRAGQQLRTPAVKLISA